MQHVVQVWYTLEGRMNVFNTMFKDISPDARVLLKDKLEKMRVEYGYYEKTKAERKKIDSAIHREWKLFIEYIVSKAVEKDYGQHVESARDT